MGDYAFFQKKRQKQKSEKKYDAKKYLFDNTRDLLVCDFCFLPGLNFALASLGLRHAILETAYKVTEAKSETQSPQVLMNK